MKTLFSICFLLACWQYAEAQNPTHSLSSEHFEEQILQYQPKLHAGITQANLDYALMILSDTKRSVKGKVGNFNLGDYFNVLSAFLTLKESEHNISLAFRKFVAAEGSCEYIIAFEKHFRENPKYAPVKNQYQPVFQKCQSGAKPAAEFDLMAYAKKYRLDADLVKVLHDINEADKRYRKQESADWYSKQQPLDAENQERIESLYRQYGKYIGRSLVGPTYEHTMWAVIQHADVEMMEKYLPVLQQAVQEEELAVAPFKMLLDRFYGLKHGYQIFGSQSGFGFKMADEELREKIVRQYGIEE